MDYDVNNKQEHTFPHVCGQCNMGFETEAEYCDHTCGKTGFTPVDMEHFGEEFKAISDAALERGAKRQADENPQ